jgi:protein-S-isoprenylcysteine O-methyltransferase Ste14
MPGNPLTDPNWAPDLTDTVVRVVGTVRDKATLKAVVVVRALVFGIVISIAALAALVLLIVVATKFSQVVLGRITRADADSVVWISYFTMGGVLLVLGSICMRLRRTPTDAA